MPAHPIIFLDDGGVMNDNHRRGTAWRRLVAEFFAPRLGGAPGAWQNANVFAISRAIEAYERYLAGQSAADVKAFVREHFHIRWLRTMCEQVGVEPPGDDHCAVLAEEAYAWVTPRVDSAMPGATEAVRRLHAAGYQLFTASGETSAELHGYLTGMGVRDHFVQLYGPDLINTPKEGVAYYEHAFAAAGIDPRDAVVVDDFPVALQWAATAGARTVWVRGDRGEATTVDLVVEALSELPDEIGRLA